MGSFICPNCGVSAYSWETPNCVYCGYTRPTSDQVKKLRSQGYSDMEIIKKFTLYTAVEVTIFKKTCPDKFEDIKDDKMPSWTYNIDEDVAIAQNIVVKAEIPIPNEEVLSEEITLRQTKIHMRIYPICGKEFAQRRRYCSDDCKQKRRDEDGLISVIKDDFIHLKAIRPEEAQSIADEMEIIEGKEFREMALDGLAPFKNPKIKEHKKGDKI